MSLDGFWNGFLLGCIIPRDRVESHKEERERERSFERNEKND